MFAFLLGANDKLISESHLIFYNNLTSLDCSQSVQHTGDNETGVGEGAAYLGNSICINFEHKCSVLYRSIFPIDRY